MSGTPVSSNTKKERLSIAYVQAVAARAGYEVLETRIDIDSVDGVLKATHGRRPQIDFQAKATSTDVVLDSHVAFPLLIKNYEDLRAETVIPRILVVFVMPDEPSDWLSQNENELVLRKCAYWMSLRGQPSSQNTTSVTVRIPRVQIFDDRQLQDLMVRAEKGPNL